MRRAGLVAALSLWAAASAVAQEIAPFATFNQSPIIQIHGLPGLGAARVLDAGRSRYSVQADHSSNYTTARAANESVLFDGETTRGMFAFQHGLGNHIELGMEIPYVGHRGGSLDDFIVDWHDFFRLPQGGRDSAPTDQLTYRYVRNGQEALSLTEPMAGVGDVRITAAWQWREEVALRALLKLPNGDSERLLGSGGADLALWASGSQPQRWFDLPGSWFGGAGVLLMGDGDVLAEQQRRTAVFGTLGAGLQLSPRLLLKLQLDAHSALYRGSALKPIAANAVQLGLGGDVVFSKHTRLALGVVEDLAVKASPDVVFHLALTVDR